MTTPAPLPRPVIIERLRSAGCVFAEDEADLLISAAQTAAQLSTMVEQRVIGTPIEHVIGWAEFCGQRIALQPGVFVPRRRTEFLAHQAAGLAAPGAVVVDLCCGSGAIGVALAGVLGQIELHAVDVDPNAVRCAERNVTAVGGHVYEGDLYEPLPAHLRARIDILLANVPYVPTEAIGTMPPEARVHEPKVALDGGADGLAILRRVVSDAPLWLAPGGHLLVETSERQAPEAADVMARGGLVPDVAHSDELNALVVLGSRR